MQKTAVVSFILSSQLFAHDYILGKQAKFELSKKYSVSLSTIARELNQIRAIRVTTKRLRAFYPHK